MKVKPLFKWAGGKSKMLAQHTPFLPPECKVYSEPFFGGGAMFLWVQENLKPKQAFIGDVNGGLVNIYRAVQSDHLQLLQELQRIEDSFLPLDHAGRKSFYYNLRHKHAFEFQDWSPTQEAAALLFMIRICFNGIWLTGPVTGGRFSTAAGTLTEKKIVNAENIVAWNELLKNAEIIHGNYTECPTGDVNYFDPPYRNSQIGYKAKWEDRDMEALLEWARACKGRTLVCNRDEGDGWFNESRVQGFDVHKFHVNYTAGRGTTLIKTTEILLVGTR